MTPAITTGTKLQTLNPQHWSNSPKPYTLDPRPSAMKNQTLNPKTLNRKEEPNPKP